MDDEWIIDLRDIVDEHLHDRFKRLCSSLIDNQKLYNDFNPEVKLIPEYGSSAPIIFSNPNICNSDGDNG
ncbi:MAG: hypothetical protein ACYC0F_18550 [Rhodanobacter sp.]